MRFTCVINGRGVKPHAACWEDFASALVAAIREAGHEVVPLDDPKGPGRLTMFGANGVVGAADMPPDAICFNTEQLAAVDDPVALMQGIETYRNRVVWDYSEANATVLRDMGAKRVVVCPIGYHESMTKVPPSLIKVYPDGFVCERLFVKDESTITEPPKDIDVLFYGAMSARRKRVLEAVMATGLRVERLFGVYGKERDEVILRSKVVLNVHFYDKAVFEIFRCSHLFANRVCVVSERGADADMDLALFAAKATKCVPLEMIPAACVELCADEGKRREQAERGYRVFRETSLVENVKRAIEASA